MINTRFISTAPPLLPRSHLLGGPFGGCEKMKTAGSVAALHHLRELVIPTAAVAPALTKHKAGSGDYFSSRSSSFGASQATKNPCHAAHGVESPCRTHSNQRPHIPLHRIDRAGNGCRRRLQHIKPPIHVAYDLRLDPIMVLKERALQRAQSLRNKQPVLVALPSQGQVLCRNARPKENNRQGDLAGQPACCTEYKQHWPARVHTHTQGQNSAMQRNILSSRKLCEQQAFAQTADDGRTSHRHPG